MVASLGGAIQEPCGLHVEQPCWEDCAHKNKILESHYNFENYSGRHLALTEAILDTQDSIIKDICAFDLDLCVKGAIKGFPCVQCGYICEQKFSFCGTLVDDCGYGIIDPLKSACGGCKLKICEVDFLSTPELKEIYEKVINALAGSYTANARGVKKMLDLIYNVDSKLLSKKSYIYKFDLGRTLTDLEIRTWLMISAVLPLPVGWKIQLVRSL